MSGVSLRRLGAAQSSNWPETLAVRATFTSLDSWLNFVHRVYKFPIYRFETKREEYVSGLLALVHVQHPIFGNYLTTSPFGSYGGFAYSDIESRDLLLWEAQRLAAELKVDYANLRFVGDDLTAPDGWIEHPIYCTYLLDLPSDPNSLFRNFDRGHRNDIRRSLKKGFSIKFGHHELLNDAYENLARCMHELGSPYHGKIYLSTMAELMAETLEFAILYAPDGRLAGTGVFIRHANVVTSLHANILRAFRSACAGDFLYWNAIQHYSQYGLKVFDLGRSLVGSGHETFKMKWKPRKQRLGCWYTLKPGVQVPELTPKNPRFAVAVWMWKHLPTFVVRAFGPFLIRGLA